MTFWMWKFTVRSEIFKIAPISQAVLPATVQRRISTSRPVSGTGSGTSELQRVQGFWTNKQAITNGPGANLGTYVGTIRTDGAAVAATLLLDAISDSHRGSAD